jgi:hypothetical protein
MVIGANTAATTARVGSKRSKVDFFVPHSETTKLVK